MGTSSTQKDAGSGQGWVLALASVGSFMVALDGLVVMTALSTIRRDLDASIAQLEWTVNAFTLSFAVLLMTGAALGDRWGRRRMFVVGLAVFTAASALCAIAPGPGWLVGARALQGAGAALVTPVALALIGAAYPPQRRGWALGVYSSAIGLAVLSGPVVGGAVTEGIAWQWIFWLNLPIGLGAIGLVLSRIEESFGPRTTLDLLGVALVTAGSFGLVWGLVRGNSVGWGSGEVVTAFAAGAVAILAFIAWELRTSTPMLPMRLFRSRAFSAGNAVSFLLFASNLAATYFLVQFFQEVGGDGPLEAGLRLLPLTAALFILAPQAGRIVDRVGERPLIVGGLLLQAIGMAWLAVIADPELEYAAMIAPMVLAGAGTAMTMPAGQKAVVGAVPPSDIGRASGTFATMRWFGGTFGIAIAVAIFAGVGGYGSATAFSDGFAPALALAAGLALLGAIAGLGVPGRARRRLPLGSSSGRAADRPGPTGTTTAAPR